MSSDIRSHRNDVSRDSGPLGLGYGGVSLGTWFCTLQRNVLPTSSMILLTS